MEKMTFDEQIASGRGGKTSAAFIGISNLPDSSPQYQAELREAILSTPNVVVLRRTEEKILKRRALDKFWEQMVPTTPYSNEELAEIVKGLEKSGSVIMMSDPDTDHATMAEFRRLFS